MIQATLRNNDRMKVKEEEEGTKRITLFPHLIGVQLRFLQWECSLIVRKGECLLIPSLGGRALIHPWE